MHTAHPEHQDFLKTPMPNRTYQYSLQFIHHALDKRAKGNRGNSPIVDVYRSASGEITLANWRDMTGAQFEQFQRKLTDLTEFTLDRNPDPVCSLTADEIAQNFAPNERPGTLQLTALAENKIAELRKAPA